MKYLFCEHCKDNTRHNIIAKVGILTKWRTVKILTYKCSKCGKNQIVEKQRIRSKKEVMKDYWD